MAKQKSQQSFYQMFDLNSFFDNVKDYVLKYTKDILNEKMNKDDTDSYVSPLPKDVEASYLKPKNQDVLGAQIKEPSQEVKPNNWEGVYRIVKGVFGDEALNMMEVLKGENRGLNFRAENINKDGSIDRGLFQINSNTFADFMRRKKDKLYKEGITSYEDMYDPVKNAKMAKIIWEEQGYKAWYGAPERLRNK